MSLDFEKVTYVDGETVIGAENLNNIQDAILDLDSNKVEKEQGKVLSTNDYTNEEKAKVAAAAPASALNDYRTAAAQDTIDAAQDERIDAAAQATTATTIGPAPIVTFDASAADMPLKSLTVNIEPVQTGSGDPSPSNVRPISGWTGCNVTRTGKNLVSKISDGRTNNSVTYTPNQNGGIQVSCSSTSHSKSYSTTTALAKTFILDPGTYTISANIQGTAISLFVAFLPTGRSGFVTRSTASQVFTLAEKTEVYIAISVEANGVSDEAIYPMLEFGSTASPYEPFGAVYSITFPASAGTVYGGTLDVVNKKLTINGVCVKSTWGDGENATIIGEYERRRYRALGYDTSIFNKWLCNVTGDFRTTGYSGDYLHVTAITDGNYVSVYLPVGTDNNTPIDVYYPLIAPVQFDLTDIPEILTLYGKNNIWADCGDVTVTYGAYLETVKAHAERLGDSILSAIAPLETTYTASRAYTVGEFLFVGTKFYKVTAAIAEGGTITPGTNAVQTTVAEQLMTLAVKPAILG